MFVFSTGRSGRGKTGATGEARPISGWSKAKTALDKIALQKLQALAEERREELPTEFPEWHLHDLRRTCATNLARLGVDRVVISKVLNHAESEVTAIYDRHRYDAEMRRALDAWGERLQAIVEGKEQRGNVVVMPSARGAVNAPADRAFRRPCGRPAACVAQSPTARGTGGRGPGLASLNLPAD